MRKFNGFGPESLASGWQGHPGKSLTDGEFNQLREVVSKPPREVGLRTGRWTASLATAFIERFFNKKLHPETVRKYLRSLGFSFRKPDTKYVKATPEKHQEFINKLDQLERERSPRSRTFFADEGQYIKTPCREKADISRVRPQWTPPLPEKKTPFLRGRSPIIGQDRPHAHDMVQPGTKRQVRREDQEAVSRLPDRPRLGQCALAQGHESQKRLAQAQNPRTPFAAL